NTGVWRTTDGGSNWTNVTAGSIGNSTADYTDFELDPTNQNVGYCAIGSPSGNAANGVYKTTNLLDAAPTWSLVPTVTSGTANGPTVIAISPSNPQTLYVAISSTGSNLAKFYQSTNGGASWTDRTATTPNFPAGQGNYDLAVAVDPANPNTVIAG